MTVVAGIVGMVGKAHRRYTVLEEQNLLLDLPSTETFYAAVSDCSIRSLSLLDWTGWSRLIVAECCHLMRATARWSP